jgi:DNA-binding CsgD family transcriptional regulator
MDGIHSPLTIRADNVDEAKASDVGLSPRERAVVLLMGHGLSNKEIARQLRIAPETVKSHAKHIFEKLTVRSRAQAVYRQAGGRDRNGGIWKLVPALRWMYVSEMLIRPGESR